MFEKRRLINKSGDGESSKSETHDGGEKKNNNQNENGKKKDATFICRKGYSALVDRRFDGGN